MRLGLLTAGVLSLTAGCFPMPFYSVTRPAVRFTLSDADGGAPVTAGRVTLFRSKDVTAARELLGVAAVDDAGVAEFSEAHAWELARPFVPGAAPGYTFEFCVETEGAGTVTGVLCPSTDRAQELSVFLDGTHVEWPRVGPPLPCGESRREREALDGGP